MLSVVSGAWVPSASGFVIVCALPGNPTDEIVEACFTVGDDPMS